MDNGVVSVQMERWGPAESAALNLPPTSDSDVLHLISPPPFSLPWRDRIVEALGLIGAEAAAENSLKYIQREDYKENK